MDTKRIEKILRATAYSRTAGSQEELDCALFLKELLLDFGFEAHLQFFPITTYEPLGATLTVDEKEFISAPVFGSKIGSAEGRIHHLTTTENLDTQNLKGSIILSDKALSRKNLDNIIEQGATGVVLFSGDCLFGKKQPQERELRIPFLNNEGIPVVNIHTSSAAKIIESGLEYAKLSVDYKKHFSQSANLLLDIKGESDETIIFSAHYDSTPNSFGAYDNMSSCIALLSLAEYYSKIKPYRSLKFIWCGAEERGLLGSLAFCKENKIALKKALLNINLDMLGPILGEFVGFDCANKNVLEYMKDFFKERKIPASVRYGIRSSDSNSFAFYGVPAVSFARYAPENFARIHTQFDTKKVLSAKQLQDDIEIIRSFSDSLILNEKLPCDFQISSKIKKAVSAYMERSNIKKS